ncbi:hypothetical protein F511_12524 [Dorcoceras hygrometricum]|uniref:Transcriptional coactivator Hfi1/Transcriptional adapter 1 n=1 Tax=Dorcoceras hygrometricum TaxID=472368 RepID=A0A2Z7DDN2_9LAMI|nr:hypothetical protein F511_12524 [Dorcoceras hygrometricum]
MRPPHQHSRINLVELKAQIVKKLGAERSKQYFHYLNRLLSLKVSKGEFDKLCVGIIGRENIPLHNQFIRSILRNACGQGGPPPSIHKDDVLKHEAQVGGKVISADGYQNGSHIGMTQALSSPGSSNGGDMLPVSPRKARSGNRDRRTGERRSALGPNGKINFSSQVSMMTNQSNEFNVIVANGDINPPHIGRHLQHHQGHAQLEKNENENEIPMPHPAKLSGVGRSSDGPSPVHNKDNLKLVVREDGKQVSSRISLEAPLGVPLFPVSVGGARRNLPPESTLRCIGTFSDGALLDSLTLRERMEQITVTQEIEGVSVDCANILNHGLDSYLKRLITSCVEIVGSRSGHELTRNNTHKLHHHMKLINGVRPAHHYQMLGSGKPWEVQEQRTYYPISLQDFRVAMELNPRQLGEDWPLLLEKICTRAFEE